MQVAPKAGSEPAERYISLDHLLRYMRLQPAAQERMRMLTHQSIDEQHNNSRYIFLGMYAFKGLVCQWIFTHIQGTGTQLQQYFGNITSPMYFSKLFSLWGLAPHARLAIGLDAQSHRHLFAAALLGFLVQHAHPQDLQRLIYRFFIAPHDHLLPGSHIVKDDWQQLLWLCKQQGWPKPQMQYTATNEGLHRFEVMVNNLPMLQHSSVSYRYARKKAMRLALKAVVTTLNLQLEKQPAHHDLTILMVKKEREAQDKDRAARIEAWKNRKTLKATEKAEIKEEKRKKALETDRKRRTTKLQVKNKKTKETIYRTYTQEEISAMTVSKRRNLQDRDII